MNMISIFSQNLKKQMHEKQLTVKSLAEQSGVSESTIYSILKEKSKTLRIKTVYLLCVALKTKMSIMLP